MGSSQVGGIKQKRNGQVLLLFAIALPVLIGAAALAIDFGFAYITRVNLSKAVDAAAIAAMTNVNQGQAEAQQIGEDAFNANFPGPMTGGAPAPTVTVTIGTNANGNTTVTVNASATINTDFLHLFKLPTLTIASSAQAVRPQLIMSLVLDKSGSMDDNGGAQALPPAVAGSCSSDNPGFICYFNNAADGDYVADVTFGSTASIDVPIKQQFLSSIQNSVDAINFGGGTFSQAGLQDGLNEINSVTTSSGEEVVKVAVFFTDGWANTINDNLSCAPKSPGVNYDGCAPNENSLGWCSGINFMSPTTGNPVNCDSTEFPSEQYGKNETISQQNVANEADYRALQVALTMQNQGIYVYAIGLGDLINQQFLQEVANDPSSPTFNANLPIGEAIFAPTAADLQGVFQVIASKILLRLSQ